MSTDHNPPDNTIFMEYLVDKSSNRHEAHGIYYAPVVSGFLLRDGLYEIQVWEMRYDRNTKVKLSNRLARLNI